MLRHHKQLCKGTQNYLLTTVMYINIENVNLLSQERDLKKANETPVKSIAARRKEKRTVG